MSGLPIAPDSRKFPARIGLAGLAVQLEPLSADHVGELWCAAQHANQSWTYLRYGPFESEDRLLENVIDLAERPGQPFWAVRPASTGHAAGWLSLCDICPTDGNIEIGSIWFSPDMQRTRAATEAVFLLMRYAFDELRYQRLVWRCVAENYASRNSAQRYGFKFEGTWRSAALVKGKRLGLAWHSILAEEWPARRSAITAWLADANFDCTGRALSRLPRTRV